MAAVCGGTESSVCLHHSYNKDTPARKSLSGLPGARLMQLSGPGRAQVSESMRVELSRAVVQVPQSWDKSIFYQTREVRRSLAGDERQGNLSGASRGKRLRSEPLDSAKCSSVIFCYEYT